MNKSALLLAATMIVLSSCSKTEPEKEPAEQVIGTYEVDRYSQSVKYDKSPNTLTSSIDFPYREAAGEVTYAFDVAKKSSNTIILNLVQSIKPTGGTVRRNTTPFGDFELRRADNAPAGEFILYDLTYATESGTIGNNSILYKDSGSDTDSVGKYNYSLQFSGKKTN